MNILLLASVISTIGAVRFGVDNTQSVYDFVGAETRIKWLASMEGRVHIIVPCRCVHPDTCSISDAVLQANMLNPMVGKVHLVCASDTSPPTGFASSHKLVIHNAGDVPFSVAADLANKVVPTSDVAIITTPDVVLDASVANLRVLSVAGWEHVMAMMGNNTFAFIPPLNHSRAILDWDIANYDPLLEDRMEYELGIIGWRSEDMREWVQAIRFHPDAYPYRLARSVTGSGDLLGPSHPERHRPRKPPLPAYFSLD